MGLPPGAEFDEVVIGSEQDHDWLLLDAGGQVIGRVRWDGKRPWTPPPGVDRVVREDQA